MRLPFTIDQFLDVFRRYNLAVWQAQWVLVEPVGGGDRDSARGRR